MTGWADYGLSATTAIWDHPGKGHDRVLLEDTFAGVADGATPLDPASGDPGELAEAGLTAIAGAVGSGASPRDVFAEAIAATRTVAGTGPTATNCAVAVAWLADGHVTVSVLGDCLALVVPRTGPPVVATDPAVRRLDELALQLPPHRRAAALRAHRALANTVAGYWIYGNDVRAADHLVTARFGLAEIKAIVLCTDGLQAVSPLAGAFEGQPSTDLRTGHLGTLTESVGHGPDDQALVVIESFPE